MNKNKDKILNSLYRLFRGRKSTTKKRVNKKYFSYKFTLKSSLVSYATPTYSEKNLVIDVWESIGQNPVFIKLAPLYSQVKLIKLAFKAIPRMISGNEPKPVWIYLDTNGGESFNYVNLPEVQGSKLLPVKKTSFSIYTRSGRQTDFHYWRDLKDIQTPVGLKLRIRSEAEPSNQVYWSFQVYYYISLRGMVLPVTDSLKLEQIADGEQKLFKKQDEQNQEDGQLSDSWGAEENEEEEIKLEDKKKVKIKKALKK